MLYSSWPFLVPVQPRSPVGIMYPIVTIHVVLKCTWFVLWAHDREIDRRRDNERIPALLKASK